MLKTQMSKRFTISIRMSKHVGDKQSNNLATKKLMLKLKQDGYFVAYLRSLLTHIKAHNLLYINTSSTELVSNTRESTILLESLPFKVNAEKSSYTPGQEIQHLGFILNTATQNLSLPSDKILRIKATCQQLLKTSPQTTIRVIAKTVFKGNTFLGWYRFSQEYCKIHQDESIVNPGKVT